MSLLKGLFLAVFSFVIILDVSSQKLEELIDYADHQFDQGMYKIAAREYQRALFFGPKEHVGKLNVKTGDCYFEMDNFLEAEKYFRFAASTIKEDSLRAETILKKSTCNLLMGKYMLSLFDLLNLNGSFSIDIERKKNMLLGIAYFGINDFKASESYFEKLVDDSDRKKLNELFKSRKLTKPDPDIAYWMSVVLPGSGQFYAGDFRNGANSLLLSATLLTLGIRMASLQSVWDAIFTVFPWFQRYYVGGYNSARQIAEQKRKNNRALIYKELFKTIYSTKK